MGCRYFFNLVEVITYIIDIGQVPLTKYWFIGISDKHSNNAGRCKIVAARRSKTVLGRTLVALFL
jgi:hypothetical protein